MPSTLSERRKEYREVSDSVAYQAGRARNWAGNVIALIGEGIDPTNDYRNSLMLKSANTLVEHAENVQREVQKTINEIEEKKRQRKLQRMQEKAAKADEAEVPNSV